MLALALGCPVLLLPWLVHSCQRLVAENGFEENAPEVGQRCCRALSAVRGRRTHAGGRSEGHGAPGVLGSGGAVTTACATCLDGPPDRRVAVSANRIVPYSRSRSCTTRRRSAETQRIGEVDDVPGLALQPGGRAKLQQRPGIRAPTTTPSQRRRARSGRGVMSCPNPKTEQGSPVTVLSGLANALVIIADNTVNLAIDAAA